jgi:hypothetical protein
MSVLTITAEIIRSGYPIAGTMKSQNGSPKGHNKPSNVADYRKQAWTAIPKVFGACEFILVRPTLINLQLF